MLRNESTREIDALTRASVATLVREFHRTFPSLSAVSERIIPRISARALSVFYPSVAHSTARAALAARPCLANASGQSDRDGSADCDAAIDLIDDWIISHACRIATLAVNNIRAALERLSAHQPQMFRRCPGVPILDDIKFLGMETHNLGLCPLQFSYSHGRSVVYKPTCVQTQKLFQKLCQDLVRGPTVLPHFCPAVLASGPNYGFVEYVSVRRCLKSPVAMAKYYRRAGQLVALCYALNATDMHHENLLVARCHPVLIDFETMLYRYPKMFGHIDITSTGLVQPARKSTKATSGLQGGLNVSFIEPVLLATNATYLRVAYRNAGNDLDNRPFDSTGKPSNPYHFRHEIIAGMNAMYELVARKRKQIAETIQRAVEIREHRIRHILRFTSYYLLHILQLYQPQSPDTSKTHRFRHFARLKTDESAAEPLSDSIVDAEISDITNGDVPYFYSDAQHHDLLHGRCGTIATQYFQTSALQDVIQRMESFTARHQKEQSDLLRSSLDFHSTSSLANP